MADLEKSQVIIFEDSEDPLYRDVAVVGAELAGWKALAFGDPHEALDHLDADTGALITGLGTTALTSELSGSHPANRLIARSDELFIPRAIYSGHPNAAGWVRTGTLDVLVPKMFTERSPLKIAEWLGAIDLHAVAGMNGPQEHNQGYTPGQERMAIAILTLPVRAS